MCIYGETKLLYSGFDPQGRLCRPEERFLRRERRRPEQIIASLQFFRSEISAEISEKTVILLPDGRSSCVYAAFAIKTS
jgi:hypothetical protein